MTGTVPYVFQNAFGTIPLSQLDADLEYLRQSIKSVKDYGAVGDGVTDDTAAIQAAINATVSALDHRLYFPQGTYKVSATLNVLGTVYLQGAGKWRTQIYRTGDYGDTMRWGSPSSGVTDIQMSDMWLLYDYGMVTNGSGQVLSIVRKPTTGSHLHIYNGINCRMNRCRLDNMVDNMIVDAGAYTSFHECEFQGLFDSTVPALQASISNVTLTSSGGLGHPAVITFDNCSFYGYYSVPRTVTYNGTPVPNLSENLGPLYMMRVSSVEVLRIEGGYMGGANSYSLILDTSLSTTSSVNVRGVHFDGDRLSNICITNSAGAGTAYNTLIQGCTFVGGNGLNCILVPDNLGVGTAPYFGLDIVGNDMYQVVSTPITLSDGQGARIIGNNIRSYNIYNAYSTQATSSAIAIMGNAKKSYTGQNSVGGGVNYEAPGANNRCNYGVYVATLAANNNVVLPGSSGGLVNDIDRGVTASPSYKVRGENEEENILLQGEISVAGAASITAQNKSGASIIALELRAALYHYLQGFDAIFYNTFTNVTNYDGIRTRWASNVYEMLVQAVGTGTARDLKIGSNANGSTLYFRMNNTDRWSISNSGHISPVTTNAVTLGSSGLDVQRLYTRDVNGRSGTADPTTTDIPAGGWCVWKNTTVPETRLWYNDAGSMKKSVALT